MSMTVNDVYLLFQKLIRSDGALSLDQKEMAFNEGYLLFVEKMINQPSKFDEFLTFSNLATTTNSNTVDLPSDFFKLYILWKKVGTVYFKFGLDSNVTLDKLTDITTTNFFNASSTGDPTFFSIVADKIYLNQHIITGDSAGLKIAYYKLPETIDFYDKIPIASVSGTFQVGETILGSSSQSTAIIKTVSPTYLYVYSDTINGQFSQSETITGQTSSVTASTNGAIIEKAQTLSIGLEYKNMLAQAVAMMYFKMRGILEEAEAAERTLDGMIKLRQTTNLNAKRFRSTLR